MKSFYFPNILLHTALFLILSLPISSQTSDHQQTVTSSITNKDAKFLLFPTRNNFIFLKLNTSNGEVYMVQFTLDDPANRFETKIESWEYPLVEENEESNGRFYLYPTSNFFNFLLMDQIDGRVWQLQWGFEKKDNMLVRIPNPQTSFNQNKPMPQTNTSLKESTMISDLEYKNNLFHKNGNPYTGAAYSTDKLMKSFFYEGKYNFTRVYHSNGTQDAFTFEQGSDIPDKIDWFLDESGNKITKEMFIQKYPATIQKAKEYAQTFEL